MATIARIIVTENDLQNKNKLFSDFIGESKKILSKKEKHQFVLLPAGFLTFSINADLANTPLAEPEDEKEKQQWHEKIESLKEEALAEFYRSFDAETLKELNPLRIIS